MGCMPWMKACSPAVRRVDLQAHSLAVGTPQVLSRIKNVIFCNSVWTFIVVWLSKRLGLSPLPSGAHSLLASALFLLLVFRTNSSVRHCFVPPSPPTDPSPVVSLPRTTLSQPVPSSRLARASTHYGVLR